MSSLHITHNISVFPMVTGAMYSVCLFTNWWLERRDSKFVSLRPIVARKKRQLPSHPNQTSSLFSLFLTLGYLRSHILILLWVLQVVHKLDDLVLHRHETYEPCHRFIQASSSSIRCIMQFREIECGGRKWDSTLAQAFIKQR